MSNAFMFAYISYAALINFFASLELIYLESIPVVNLTLSSVSASFKILINILALNLNFIPYLKLLTF